MIVQFQSRLLPRKSEGSPSVLWRQLSAYLKQLQRRDLFWRRRKARLLYLFELFGMECCLEHGLVFMVNIQVVLQEMGLVVPSGLARPVYRDRHFELARRIRQFVFVRKGLVLLGPDDLGAVPDLTRHLQKDLVDEEVRALLESRVEGLEREEPGGLFSLVDAVELVADGEVNVDARFLLHFNLSRPVLSRVRLLYLVLVVNVDGQSDVRVDRLAIQGARAEALHFHGALLADSVEAWELDRVRHQREANRALEVRPLLQFRAPLQLLYLPLAKHHHGCILHRRLILLLFEFPLVEPNGALAL